MDGVVVAGKTVSLGEDAQALALFSDDGPSALPLDVFERQAISTAHRRLIDQGPRAYSEGWEVTMTFIETDQSRVARILTASEFDHHEDGDFCAENCIVWDHGHLPPPRPFGLRDFERYNYAFYLYILEDDENREVGEVTVTRRVGCAPRPVIPHHSI